MNQALRNLLKGGLRRLLHLLGAPFPAAGPRVLVYHSVDDIDSPISVSPDLFRRQMDLIQRKGFSTWTAGEFVDALADGRPLPNKLVVITFDDGYLNNVTRALPILEERGMKATVFMVTRNDGDTPRWTERDLERIKVMIDEVYPGSPADKQRALEQTMATLTERIATWDELRGAPERGLEVLSHTRTHPYMDEIGDQQLRDELEGSRRDIAEHGLGGCNALAWPYGSYDDRVIDAARAAGYRGTFLGEPVWELRAHPDPMRIARVSIEAATGVFGLAFQLGRGYDLWCWLKHLRRR